MLSFLSGVNQWRLKDELDENKKIHSKLGAVRLEKVTKDASKKER
jgi:hypothetical protein